MNYVSKNEEGGALARQKRRHVVAGMILGSICLGSFVAAATLLVPNGTHVPLPGAEEKRLVAGMFFCVIGTLSGIAAFFSLTGIQFESD